MNRQLILICLLFLFITSCNSNRQNKRPNVLILLADDMGYTDLRCFGGEALSPNLDKLAKSGIKFTHFYAPAPNCSPSRTGLLTGRMPSRVGMYNYRKTGHTMHLPAAEVTIAELLKEEGYQTAHFGKWHLSCLPQNPVLNQAQPIEQGFDFSLGTENNAEPSHLNPENFVRQGKPLGKIEGYSCQILAKAVKTWFDELYEEDRPFFMYVAYHEVHSKIASPDKMIAKYKGKSKKEAEYLANVENMDDATGKILDELKKRGVLENTLVLFASDNGPEKLGQKGNLRGRKSEIYEGGIRVPGIVSWPHGIKKGQVNETPAGLIDVLPTLAEVCNFELPLDVKIDGADLSPLFANEPLTRETPLMWFFYRSYPEVSLRIEDYVLIGNALDSIPRTHPTSNLDMEFIKSIELKEFELYNVIKDSAQEHNLLHKEPKVVEVMKPHMIHLLNEIKTDGPTWEGLFDYSELPSKFKQKYIRK